MYAVTNEASVNQASVNFSTVATKLHCTVFLQVSTRQCFDSRIPAQMILWYILVYLLTPLAAEQAEKYILQVKIVHVCNWLNILCVLTLNMKCGPET